MPGTAFIPILKELLPGGLSYGSNFLVEFAADSIWYETSLTIAEQALKQVVKTDYHTFQHSPKKVRESLAGFGLNLEQLEKQGTFRLLDTYTVQTGLGVPEETEKAGPGGAFWARSMKLSDWSIGYSQDLKGNVPEVARKRLHIDDNTSVLGRYNKENEFIDFWRTRIIPYATQLELTMVHSLVTGVYTDAFYKQFESLCDGIIDFKSEEKSGRIEHFVRVRLVRGQSYDSRWRKLRLMDNGEVTLAE